MTRKPVVPLTADEMLVIFRAMRYVGNALSTLGNKEEFPLRPNPRTALWHASEALSAVMGYQMTDNQATIDEAYRRMDTVEMPERVEWQHYGHRGGVDDSTGAGES